MTGGYYREDPRAQPSNAFDAYASSRKRAPRQSPIHIEHTISEITGPRFGRELLRHGDEDLTQFDGGQALGERIVVTGRVLDENGHQVPGTLLEIWQANAAGRYAHDRDRHDAPLDPHFRGAGRVLTDEQGVYRFLTIKPGAYPWQNHHNAWRPNHIHFSIFGPSFATRLVTQMYFPGDPLLELDPIFNSIPDRAARARLIATFGIDLTQPEYALGYRFDIVLRGQDETPLENRS